MTFFNVPSIQGFFLRFFFFGIKLGHFTINNFFLYVTKMQAYQQKMEKFFVIEQKKLVGSTLGLKVKTNFVLGEKPEKIVHGLKLR